MRHDDTQLDLLRGIFIDCKTCLKTQIFRCDAYPRNQSIDHRVLAMLRLFLPLYVLILLFILFSEEVFEFALLQYAAESYEEDKKHDYNGLLAIMDKLAAEIEIAEYHALLAHINQDTNIPLQLIPRAQLALAPSGIAALERGEIWFASIEHQLMYKQLAGTDYVVRVGPMHTIDDLEREEALVSYSIALLVLGLVLIWALNFQRKLSSLERVTQALGRGELQARASTANWHRVGTLNQTFNQMAEHVQTLIKSHKDLNNAVSHELRTPIARMNFELESLRDAEDAQEKAELIQGMEDDLNELEQLVDELLNYARFERQHFDAQFSYQAFAQWLENWQQRHRHHSPKQLHILQPVPQNIVPLLPELLNRAVDNLVFNAYRYAASQVQISAEIRNQQLYIHIDDDGCGIPEQYRATLFEPFVRVDKSRNRQTGGFGLGLSIVREIARRHGGDAEISDSPLGGARFSLFWAVDVRK